MRTLEDKISELDTAAEHLGRAYDILFDLGYTGLANSVMELLDEVSNEISEHELEQDEYDGQPDEAQEWYDFDPEC